MKKALFGLMLVLTISAAAQATNVVTVNSVPTPGLPGFSANTFIITMEVLTDEIVGYDGRFDGPMNQVNPFGMPTVFQDNNVAFGYVGENVLRDSQFLFKTTNLDTVNGVLVGRAGESAVLLDGAFAMKGGRSNPQALQSVAIAQLVVLDSAIIGTKAGEGMIRDVSVVLVRDVLDNLRAEPVGIPEPATMSLLVLGAVALLRRRS